MINMFEVNETNKMITQENLDVRTITMGISLLDCISDDLEQLNQNIYDKILRLAHDLVPTGEAIEREYGIPIVNKRISVTPVALVGGNACKTPEDFVTIAKTLDKAAHEVGVNFIGGYSAAAHVKGHIFKLVAGAETRTVTARACVVECIARFRRGRRLNGGNRIIVSGRNYAPFHHGGLTAFA